MQDMITTITDTLRTVRVPAMPEEYDIHNAVADALRSAGIAYMHEAKLGPRCRIDFLCGDVGIEIKKGRPDATRLREQLSRYLAYDSVRSVIVVLQKPCALPETIGGKRVFSVALNRLWGVALP